MTQEETAERVVGSGSTLGSIPTAPGIGGPMSGLFAEALAKAQATQKPKADVVTIARAVREGKVYVQITPASNGFTMNLQTLSGYSLNLVFNRPAPIGQLLKSLYSGNLDNEEVLNRLRKLLNF